MRFNRKKRTITMQMNILIVAAFAIAGAAGALVPSQAEEYPHFFFAEEPVNPRNTAMGCTGAALDGGGFSFYNPASIAFAKSPFIGMEFGQQGGGLSKSLIETAWMFQSWFVGAVMPVQSTDWQIANEQDMGAMSSNQMFGPTIAGGYHYGPFATGHAIMLLNERIGDYAIHAVTYSTGVIYRIIPGSLAAGASAYHYLRFDPFRSSRTGIPRGWYQSAKGLPRMVRAGVAWSDTVIEIPYTVAADIVFRDVVSDDPDYKDSTRRFMAPIGIEAWILPWIAARIGKRFNHPGDLLHIGCGLRWSSLAFNFDYALDRPPAPGADLEPKWLFGLTYSLKSPVAAKEAEHQRSSTDIKPAEVKQAPIPVEKPPVPVQPSPATQDSVQKPDTEPAVLPTAPTDTAAGPGPLQEDATPQSGADNAPADSLVVQPLPAPPADTTKPQ
jgi:hypothetical protein